MRWLLCLWVVAFLLGAAQISAAPSWQCRVCEDAVQTWHDQFRCAGEFLDWGDELSPDIQGCQGPRFDCQKLAGQLKTVCLNTFKDFAITDKLRRIIWDNQMLHGDAYLTCAALGKCPKDPAPPQLLTACHKDFNNPSCGKNPGCANYTLNCPEECYVCTWLVRDFPLFGEICKPKGAALPQSVPQESDIMFLETDSNSNSYTDAQSWNDLSSRMRARSETDRGARARSRARTAEHKMMRSSRLGNALQAALRARFMTRANARAQVQAEAEAEAEAQAQGGGDADAPQTELQTGNTLTESCFSMWNEIKVSMKARYFVSWKRYVGIMADVLDRLQGTMWDANVVCKCLGRCELNRYEDLGLLETCKFDETDQKAMEYIFKDESKIQNINTAPGSESVGQTPPGSGQSV